MFHASRPFASVGLRALFAVAIAASATIACSGSGSSGVIGAQQDAQQKDDGLPCCHKGFIYKCASEDALNTCSDAS